MKETKADVVVRPHLLQGFNKPAPLGARRYDDSPTGSPKTSRASVSLPSLWACAPNISRNATSRSTSTIKRGATEAKVVEGLADAIVEVTETETIRAHDLASSTKCW